MAGNGEDGGDLNQAVEACFADSDNSMVMAFRAAKSQASWSVAGRRTRHNTKPRVLALTVMRSEQTQKFKVKFHVVKQTPTGMQGFDNLKNKPVAPQWTLRTRDDRNHLLTGILKLRKENVGRVPKVVGMDVVEMALWAQVAIPERTFKFHAILESQPLVEEVLQQLDAAQGSAEDMDEWVGIFNVKLRHMRENIESVYR